MNDSDRKLLEDARRLRKQNKKRVINLKRVQPKKLDNAFHTAHQEVFKETDCLTCANCCKTTSPIFRDVDIERLSKHLRMKPVQLIEAYLHLDDDEHYVLNSSPCTFLEDDNTCGVYEHRPQACREYPHTDRKNMHQILKLTSDNTLVCPAVNRVLERVMESLNQR